MVWNSKASPSQTRTDMSQKVKGYLARDGQFFESEPECARYEAEQDLRRLCESNDVNPDNFFMLLHEWNAEIKEYFNADNRCEAKRVAKVGTITWANADLPQAEINHEDYNPGDENAETFQQFEARRNFGMPDMGDSPHAKAVPSARPSLGSRSR